MAARHFQNPFPDYQPNSDVAVSPDHWKEFMHNIIGQIISRFPPNQSNCDGGLYVGCAGVAYMFYYLAQSDIFREESQSFLSKGLDYINAAVNYATRGRDPPNAFLLGNAGVYAVASMIYAAAGDKQRAHEFLQMYDKLADSVIPVNFFRHGSDELLVGRAGFLMGAANLRLRLGQSVHPDKLSAILPSMLTSGQEYSRKHRSPCPLMYAYYDTDYLGAAHGLCSILQMFLTHGVTSPEVVQSIDFLLQLKTPTGNYPPAVSDVGRSVDDRTELVHWCHGAPGVVYLMAKAYLVFKQPKYLQACIDAGELVWHRGLLRKGPGICHGVAGNGYVFLLLYRLTNDLKYLYRASKFAEFLLTDTFKSARTPDAPYSLYEGWAGTVCFLTDLLQPQKAVFPFFDIFA